VVGSSCRIFVIHDAYLQNLLGFLLFLKVPLGALSLSASCRVASRQADYFLVLGTVSKSMVSHGCIG
jgi:hypothetical protein